jgi:hypothetical protein
MLIKLAVSITTITTIMLYACRDKEAGIPVSVECPPSIDTSMTELFLGAGTVIRDVHIDASGTYWVVGDFGVSSDRNAMINMISYGREEKLYSIRRRK